MMRGGRAALGAHADAGAAGTFAGDGAAGAGARDCASDAANAGVAIAAVGLARWALRLERSERSYLRKCCELLARATHGNTDAADGCENGEAWGQNC